MGTIRKRQKDDGSPSYQVQVRVKGCKPVSETFDRLTDAKVWAKKTEAALREGRHFPERVAQSRTLAELIDRYVADVCPDKKGGAKTAMQLRQWKDELGFRVLSDLNPEAIAEARDKMAARVMASGKRIAGATINRYMAALSTALTTASREWGWIRDNPMRRVSKKKEARGRVRMLSDAEREKLLAACRDSGAAYLEPVVILALATGMRQGEILGLRWPDVDLARARLVLEETKNGERRGVALKGPALEVMRRQSKVRALDDDRVFPGTSSFRWAWNRAIKRSKILDFKFHDLRHTAASYLAMNGCTPSEIAAVLGHKTLQMVKRYAHLHDEHVAGVLERMADKFLSGITPSAPRAAAAGAGADVVSLDSRRAKRAKK